MKPQTANDYYGVDVSKKSLAISHNGEYFEIENSSDEILKFLRSINKKAFVAMEATNNYHIDFADIAYSHGHSVYVIPPLCARRYRQLSGMRAKTDKIDALCLENLISHEYDSFRPYKPKPEESRILKELLGRRAVLVESRSKIKQSFKGLDFVEINIENGIKELDNIIIEIDSKIDELTKNNKDCDRIISIPGVGKLTSASLLSDLISIDFKSSDAFVAYLGYDPRANDSGVFRGKRKLSKRGNSESRRLLFNAARSGIRCNFWKPLYNRLISDGKSRTEAIICIARKMIRISWSLYKNKTDFQPELVGM